MKSGGNATTHSGVAWYEVRTSADWLARRHGDDVTCECQHHPPEFCGCSSVECQCPCHYRAVWKTELEP